MKKSINKKLPFESWRTWSNLKLRNILLKLIRRYKFRFRSFPMLLEIWFEFKMNSFKVDL